jgi:hypothetical protein
VNPASTTLKDFAYFADQLEGELLDVYTAFRDYMLALNDIQVKRLKYYEAYKRIRNVATVVIQPQKKDFLVYISTRQTTWIGKSRAWLGKLTS